MNVITGNSDISRTAEFFLFSISNNLANPPKPTFGFIFCHTFCKPTHQQHIGFSFLKSKELCQPTRQKDASLQPPPSFRLCQKIQPPNQLILICFSELMDGLLVTLKFPTKLLIASRNGKDLIRDSSMLVRQKFKFNGVPDIPRVNRRVPK